METDTFYGEEESVARGWGVGRPGYAEGAGPVVITIDAHLPPPKTYGPRGAIRTIAGKRDVD